MNKQFVKPAAGHRVRRPEKQGRPIPKAGGWVPQSRYYMRRIAEGALVHAAPGGDSIDVNAVLGGTVDEVAARVSDLDTHELRALRAQEDGDQARKGVLSAIDEELARRETNGGDNA